MVSNLVELVGYGLIVAFLWFVWPPLALLGGGVLLVLWANVRTGKGRTAAALVAAVTAGKTAYQQSAELRRVA